MTIDERYEEWFKEYNGYSPNRGDMESREAYIVATKAAARRCVNICEKEPNKYACIMAIKKEFDIV